VESSMEMTAVVPVQTATGTKYFDNLYTPCIFSGYISLEIIWIRLFT
jgi:hypothetical protein